MTLRSKSLAQRRNRCSTVLVRTSSPARPNHCSASPSPSTPRPVAGPWGLPFLYVTLSCLACSSLPSPRPCLSCLRCKLQAASCKLRSCQPQHKHQPPSSKQPSRLPHPPRPSSIAHKRRRLVGHTRGTSAWLRPEDELSECPCEHWHPSGHPSAIAIGLGEQPSTSTTSVRPVALAR